MDTSIQLNRDTDYSIEDILKIKKSEIKNYVFSILNKEEKDYF